MKWLNKNKFGIGMASLFLTLPCVPGMAQETKPAQAPAISPAATPGASAAAPAMPVSQVDASSYIIGPEDGLQVTVCRTRRFPALFQSAGREDFVDLAGRCAGGRTDADAVERQHYPEAEEVIQDPTVAVVVTGVNSQKVYLVGEVGRVGPVPLTAGMTPLQAIATAGGLSTFANPKRIYILRNEGGKQQKIPFNYKQALKGDSKQLIPLKPGDTIVVP